MSVLETFYTLFKSVGVEDLEKDNARAKSSNDKLDQSLKDSEKISDDLTRSFKNMGHELLGLATSGLSLAGILSRLKSSISYTIDLDQASRALGANVSDLDAWGAAVQKTGGNVNTFENSLKNLAMHLGTTGDVALKVLPQFADSFQKMGRYGSFRYGQMLGMDESLILLLMKGRKEVEATIEQQKKLGVVTQKDAETARMFNYAWQNATRSFRNSFIEAATTVLPYITKLLDAFAGMGNYLQAHKDVMVGALTAIGAAALYAARGFFTLRKSWLLLIPVAGAVIGDLKAYAQGKDSFTGKAISKAHSWYYNAVQEFNRQKAAGIKRPDIFHPLAPSKNDLTVNPDDLEKLSAHAKAMLGISSAVALPAAGSLNSTPLASKNVSINIGDINIHAQTNDVQSLTKAIDDTLKEQLRQTLYNFDDGVIA